MQKNLISLIFFLEIFDKKRYNDPCCSTEDFMEIGSAVREINEKYTQNCLEVTLGRDLVWYKEKNNKGETTENVLMQEVDGGQRGVDIFGDEHFVSFCIDEQNIMLNQSDGGVKRYARDERGMFYRADENFNIIRLPKAKHYEPVTKAALDLAKRKVSVHGVALQARDRS